MAAPAPPWRLVGALTRRLAHGWSRAPWRQACRRYAARGPPPPPPPPPADLPVVAIVGKPNAGKSRLFNRMCGYKTAAIERNTPKSHTTRDVRYGEAVMGLLRFAAVDTAGLEPWSASTTVLGRTKGLCAALLEKADVVLFLMDARAGVTTEDADAVRWLRKHAGSAPIVSVLNKCENSGDIPAHVRDAVDEAVALGLSDPVAISAATGEGMIDLAEALSRAHPPLVDGGGDDDDDDDLAMHYDEVSRPRGRKRRRPTPTTYEDSDDDDDDTEDSAAMPLRAAIVGIPNVGKSTLMNAFLQRERSLTGPEAGLTRDVVTDRFYDEVSKVEVHLADTAGWIKDAEERRGWHADGKSDEDAARRIAAMSAQAAKGAFHKAAVAVLVLDARAAAATKGITKGHQRTARQILTKALSDVEASLLRLAEAEGRALVIALNKADGLTKRVVTETTEAIAQVVSTEASALAGAPIIPVSAATGQDVRLVLDAIAEQYRRWNARVETSELNAWLNRLKARHSGHGLGSGEQRIRYISQVATRPPRFVAWVKGQVPFQPHQARFLRNEIRSAFGFEGVPIRISVRMGRKFRG